ncbi:MAG: hypothetical protein LBP31_01690 [Holosporales bacterium]|jgi:hypothetical protein|nr:hypothetical protein [Holosporales bacterium]
MQKKIRRIRQTYNQAKTSLAKGSLLYGLSLDKRHTIFDTEKFVNDPWAGNSSNGKDFLSGNLKLKYKDFEFDMMDVIGCKSDAPLPVFLYINSFAWIRDVKTVGGINARKHIRNWIYNFIKNYKSLKKFWMSIAWNVDITSERIVNWMLSYSFFAAGADDDFEKEILSSISMQYSHISKMYISENDPIVKIAALRAILFCMCSMKNVRKKQIRNIAEELFEIVKENFIGGTGIYITRNPNSHFNVFRMLLETRFALRNTDIDFHSDILENMALVVRFLRMGDGCISHHTGDLVSRLESMFQCRGNIIDTALSLVHIKNHLPNENRGNIRGFDRISTKKSVVIINNEVSRVKSPFNDSSAPGLNIFDFEASFQTDHLINKSDISILAENRRIRLHREVAKNISRSRNDKEIRYSCEVINFERAFQFAIRREISLDLHLPILNVSEFIYTSSDSEIFIRIAMAKYAEIEQLNSSSVYVTYGRNQCIFSLKKITNQAVSFYINEIDNFHPCPTITILYKNAKNTENQINWSMEQR